jgi:Spy/CpxP family protein refolding chaperone
MRRIQWISIVAALVLLIAGGMAFAQGPGGRRGPGAPGGPGFGGPGVELRGLDLSDAQRTQIRDIVQRYQEQMRTDIMLVLTPEQQEKAKQLEAQREARMKERLQRFQQRQNQNQSQPQNQ